MRPVDWPALHLRFPDAPRLLSAMDVANIITDVNTIYELTAIVSLPGYESTWVPMQTRPRRYSRLDQDDQLQVEQLSYGSPLEVVLWSAATAWAAAKSMPGILDAALTLTDRYRTRHTRREMVQAQLDQLRAAASRDAEAHLDHRRHIAAEVDLIRAQTQGQMIANERALAELVERRQYLATEARSTRSTGDLAATVQDDTDLQRDDVLTWHAANGIVESAQRLATAAGLPTVEYLQAGDLPG